MTFVGAAEFLFTVAAVCGCAWLICHLICRFDRAAERSAYLELSEAEMFARYEAEMDHRAINTIVRRYGRSIR